MSAPIPLDAIDTRMLLCLQENARISNANLAKRVGLSPAPCLRRLRALEDSGVITKYSALLDPKAVDLALSAWVKVRLDLQVAKRFELFEQNIKQRPEVLECYLMTGEADYIVRAVVPDVASYERFLKESLSRIEGVVSTNTSFGLRVTKYSTALPLSAPSGTEHASLVKLMSPGRDPLPRARGRRQRNKSSVTATAAMMMLDEIDIHILSHMQENARISNVELADRVGLSPAPCLRRVRALEDAHVIRKYVTLLDPTAVNLAVIVWTQVRLDLQVPQRFSGFEQNIMRWREVPECYFMAGEADYLVRIVVPDVAAYERFLSGWLSKAEAVVSTSSSFVLKVVKHSTELPLNARRPGGNVEPLRRPTP